MILYKDFVKEKVNNEIKIKQAEGYPCVFNKSKGKPLKDYKIYGDSVQDGTPTPENPIEVESVGEIHNHVTKPIRSISMYEFPHKWKDISKIILTAKTKVDMSDTRCILFCTHSSSWIGVDQASYSNDTWRFTNGFSNTSASMSPLKFFNNELNTIEFSFTNSNDAYIVNVWDASFSNYTIDYYRIQFYNSNNDIVGDYYPIDTYKMYDTVSKSIITPNKTTGYQDFKAEYRVPITVQSKNLFNEELLLSDNRVTKVHDGYAVSNYPVVYNSPSTLVKHLKNVLKPDTVYTLTRKFSGYTGDSLGIITIRGLVSINIGNYKDGVSSKSFTLTQEQIDGIRFVFLYGKNVENPPIFNYIQLEEGEVATDYEPYHEPITTNIYLDEPLRKIGDIADYVDFKRKKVVRNVKPYVLTGDIGFGKYLTGENTACYYQNILYAHWQANKFISCTHFKRNGSVAYDQVGFGHGDSSSNVYFRIPIDAEYAQSSTTFQAWVKEQYDNGTPIIIYATPPGGVAEEDIELPAIITNKGTNIVTAETAISPSNVEVKYITK